MSNTLMACTRRSLLRAALVGATALGWTAWRETPAVEASAAPSEAVVPSEKPTYRRRSVGQDTWVYGLHDGSGRNIPWLGAGDILSYDGNGDISTLMNGMEAPQLRAACPRCGRSVYSVPVTNLPLLWALLEHFVPDWTQHTCTAADLLQHAEQSADDDYADLSDGEADD